MSVYICFICNHLVDIDEMGVDVSTCICPNCGNTLCFDVVPNFDTFLKEIGYVGVNELCKRCRERADRR